MKPILSIIVPVYDVEKYINKCIDSILKQTFTNFELILVDDGSTDKSGQLCDKFKDEDNRVKVIHKENSGQSESRNIGLDIAKGDYILFVDSDDVLPQDIIIKLYNSISKYNADISCCGYCDDFNVSKNQHYIYPKSFMMSNFDATKRMFLCDGIDSNVWAKMYKKFLFNDLRYPVGKIYEDVLVTYKVLLRANKIVHIGECGYIHTSRPDSTTGSKFSKRDCVYVEHTKIVYEDIKRNYPQLKKSCYLFYLNSVQNIIIRMASNNIDKRNYYYKKLKKIIDKNYYIYMNSTIFSFKNKIYITFIRFNIYSLIKNIYKIFKK
ncbi:glycosyltransferase family 2 protein [Clostridium tyrobutyricum]|uniref:glycosyltransferase family 2 protein n=1 Tax=Clostridium tyrobutyricum TaxID=1519 RepID=UPI0005802A96|nr:glycosyltransferase [Clostridium tyrobutyricum]